LQFCFRAGWPGLVPAAALFLAMAAPVRATILWSDAHIYLVHTNGTGEDILHGVVKPRDDTCSGTLYFKLQVEPRSDGPRKGISRSLAGLIFYQQGREKMGVGNAPMAWGYSAFNVPGKGPSNQTDGEYNLASQYPELESAGAYEIPRRGVVRTIVFKVEYLPGSLDRVTVWFDPNLSTGVTEQNQPANSVTRFLADASFDEIHLCHRGVGEGWKISELAIATAFEDFVPLPLWERWWFIGLVVLVVGIFGAGPVWLLGQRRAQLRIQQLERERALEQERTRIARDIHDDLGSHLSQMALLGEMMGNKVQNVEQVVFQVHKISAAARTMLESLEAIVWAVRPENDSLHSLVEYMERRTDELFENTSVNYRFIAPPEIPEQNLHAEVRHNFFLAYKESLANALKHSGATEVTIDLVCADNLFAVTIQDNGKGFDLQNPREDGHGLNNIRRRMEEISGQFELQTAPGQGTVIRLIVPPQHQKSKP